MNAIPSLSSAEGADRTDGRRRLPDKRIWVPFAVALVAGMLVHSTVYTHGLMNPDGLWKGAYSLAGSWEVSLGRWALYFVDVLHAGINSPTLAAFFTVLYMALAGTLVAALFQIRSMAKAIAIPTVLTCSPMVAMFITYPYCGDAYALSILLGVLAVYAVSVSPGKVKGTVASVLCVVLLAGLYQSSLGVMLAVAAGYVLMRLLRRPDEAGAIGKEALRLCIGAVAGMAIYYALMRLAQWAWGVSAADYKGAGDVGILSVLRSIPDGIKNAYAYFKAYFLEDWLAKNAFYTPVVYCVLAGAALVSFVVRLATASQKHPFVSVICLMLIIVFPVCCNIIYLAVSNMQTYLLMTGGVMMTLPLLIAITDVHDGMAEQKIVAWLQKALDKCGAVLAFVLVWVFILSCQTDASVMQTAQKQITALANRIWQQVEASEAYIPGETPVLIAGHPQEGNYPNPSPLVDKANVYANWGVVWTAYDGNLQTWAQVYEQYLGIAYESVSAEAYAAISATEGFQQMPLYPETGSVQKVNGVLVVKVSDTAAWAE